MHIAVLFKLFNIKHFDVNLQSINIMILAC